MMDVDVVTDINPLTGAPVLDDRCAARRWLEALHYGPTFPEQHKNNQTISARSGPITTQNPKPRRRLPQRKANTCIM